MKSRPVDVEPARAADALDEADVGILDALQRNGRATHAEMAERVGLSVTAVHERLKKLDRGGFIRGYTARLAPEAFGRTLTAYVNVDFECGASGRDVAKALERFPEIEECHSVAGEVCLLLKVRVPSPPALEELLHAIKQQKGITRTQSLVVLRTHFEGRPLPPPDLDEA
jgi:DNA-binding Lrp family transcriptional regulator